MPTPSHRYRPLLGFLFLVIGRPCLSDGFVGSRHPKTWARGQKVNHNIDSTTIEEAFDKVVMSRKACKKFHRYSEGNNTQPSKGIKTPSLSNPSVVQKAFHCLRLAQRAPTSFNTQPYKVVLVHSQEQKLKLSRYAIGPNCQRVLDADCTAVFLADREVLRTFPKYLRWMQETQRRSKPTTLKMKLQLCFYISLFSSGYPLPRVFAAPISFFVRTILSIADSLSRWFYVLPSFSSAETWATKQCATIATTYLLACTSRGLATSPMEGINAAGMRSVLGIPRRYSIPLIIATGAPYYVEAETTDNRSEERSLSESPRYPSEEMIFGDRFGGHADHVGRIGAT